MIEGSWIINRNKLSSSISKKHLTQEELGLKVGVGKAQISRIEKNYNNVTIANFLRILHALNVKVRLSVEVGTNEKKEIELSI